MGREMLKGGGKLVIASRDTYIVLGISVDIIEEGRKMSCHFEADLEQSGRSVLGIRPLCGKMDGLSLEVSKKELTSESKEEVILLS